MPEPRTELSSETSLRPVFLVDRSVFSDYSAYVRRILVGLTGGAHTSVVVCPSCVDPEVILCPSVQHIEHPALRVPIFWHQNRKILLNQLRRFKPTVIHTFYPGQIHLAHWLSKQLDIPYVIMFHKSPSRAVCFTKAFRGAAKIIAPSGFIQSRLAEALSGTDRIEQIHIASFVDDNCCCFSRSGNVASLIVVHPLNSLKVFEPFLNAIRHLVLDGVEIMVALMGKGPAEKAIRAHIRKLGLTATVTVIPPIRPIRNILAGADIYVHALDSEIFDAQLLEAMSIGLSVVGAPDASSGLLFDGQTASFWDAQDELSIYAVLKKSLGQRDKTRQIAQNGQVHLRGHHSVSRMVEKLKENYFEAQQWYKQNLKAPEQTAPAEQVS